MRSKVQFNAHIHLYKFSLNFIFIQEVWKLLNNSKLWSEGKNLKLDIVFLGIEFVPRISQILLLVY